MTGNQTPPTKGQETAQSLYKKREKIYAREVSGTFARLRMAAMLLLLGLYYGIPWVDWNGHQAVLFDLPARKFHIFNWTFWPQDFFYLSLLLIAAALALFFFTALAGRLWCGYACPQTVWTEIYMWMEYRIEGSRKAQMALDKAPMSAGKFARKATKQIVWLVFSLWTGFTFVGYFTPVQDLWHNVATWTLGPWETFWIFFYSLATYGNAGFLREQVCIYMCPYARFQSAMFDKDTLVISYDEARGEPRGPRKKSVDPKASGLGDCIDCKLCVQVCPTGIDIRNGLQYQCIGCAACVDVCDEVMDKVGYAKGLVRYTTENALKGNPAHVLRPRVILYGSLILFIFVSLFYLINTRVPLEVDINRDLARERMAADLGIRIHLDYDMATGALTASLNDAPVGMLDELVIEMVHPTLDSQDNLIRLSRTDERRYSGVTPRPLSDISWHLVIRPNQESWKISSRWNPVSSPSLDLDPSLNH